MLLEARYPKGAIAGLLYLIIIYVIAVPQQLFAQLYITHAQLVDVEKQKVYKDYTVEIKDGKIGRISPSSSFALPEAAKEINANGKWLIPGLVDAHIHLFQSGGVYTRPDAIDLRKYVPLDQEVQWAWENMQDQLRRYLARGITTVIDDGATFHLLQQKQQLQDDPGFPRVLMAGPLLSTGYMPLAFGSLDSMDAPFIEVNSKEEITAALQKQYAYQPDFIKIWYIIRSQDPAEDARKYYPLLEAAITEAHRNQLKVAVHVPELAAARMAVQAGADHLVHSIDDAIIDPEFLQLLKKNKVVVCPTLSVRGGYIQTQLQQYKAQKDDLVYGNPYQLGTLLDYNYFEDTLLTRMYSNRARSRVSFFSERDSISRINLKALLAAGIPIAAGTDAGNIGTLHAASYSKELNCMQEAGMNNWQILTAATLNGAQVLGKANEFGSIQTGKSADMLLLDADPVSDINNLKSIHLIINKGKPCLPDTLIPASPEQLVQQQLNAYNAYDLEQFLARYAEDVKVFNFPNELILEGKEAMRKQYDFLNNSPGLHAKVVQRTVLNNTVIDHERATFPGRPAIEVIAMYIIKEGKIAEVYFKR